MSIWWMNEHLGLNKLPGVNEHLGVNELPGGLRFRRISGQGADPCLFFSWRWIGYVGGFYSEDDQSPF